MIYFFIFNLLSTKGWTLVAKKHKITHYAKDVICLILAKFTKDFPVYQQLFDRLLLSHLKSGRIYTGKQMRTFMFFATQLNKQKIRSFLKQNFLTNLEKLTKVRVVKANWVKNEKIKI